MHNVEGPQLRRPPMPPRPPLLGIRVHPVVLIIVIVALIGIAVLIAMAGNHNVLPRFNPFSSPFDSIS
jgi:hypothetical protein